MNSNVVRKYFPASLAFLLMAALMFAALPGFATGTAAEGEGEKRVKKVRVVTDGDEENHFEEHRVIFIDDQGNHQEFKGEGFDWVSAHGDGENAFFVRGGGHAPGAFLGVQMTDLTPELRAHFGVSEDAGVMVSKVVEGSPAYEAGVRVGDILSSVDGENVKGASSLSSLIGKREAGETVSLQLYRDGRVESLTATLAEHEGMRHAKRIERKIQVECDGDDCEVHELHGAGGGEMHILQLDQFDCGSDECEVKVNCSDGGGCECTVNGESRDCEGLGLDHN